MKTNWKKKVDEINRSKFTVPTGWETREQVATSLECDPDRVDKLLKPGLESGAFEKQMFPVWNDERRMTVQVVCYREKPDDTSSVAVKPGSKEGRIASIIKENPKLTNYQVSRRFNNCSAEEVRRVRDGLH